MLGTNYHFKDFAAQHNLLYAEIGYALKPLGSLTVPHSIPSYTSPDHYPYCTLSCTSPHYYSQNYTVIGKMQSMMRCYSSPGNISFGTISLPHLTHNLPPLLLQLKGYSTSGKRLTDLCLIRLLQVGNTPQALKSLLPRELLERVHNILRATNPKFKVQANGMLKLLEYSCSVQ